MYDFIGSNYYQLGSRQFLKFFHLFAYLLLWAVSLPLIIVPRSYITHKTSTMLLIFINLSFDLQVQNLCWSLPWILKLSWDPQ